MLIIIHNINIISKKTIRSLQTEVGISSEARREATETRYRLTRFNKRQGQMAEIIFVSLVLKAYK